jgi:ring-1,2-phenylacetyl-CoA epoxidase subunit PaaB
MPDTQWPRYEVFLQEKEGEPYQDVGSVHAPDAELALCNARDVFVRRPACSGLWLVPVEGIFSKTAEELSLIGPGHKDQTGERTDENSQDKVYSVFCKLRPAGACTYMGEVHAGSSETAMEIAINSFATTGHPSVWWIVADHLIVRNEPEQKDSLFGPALEKTFRLSTDFRTVSAMRTIRSAESLRNSNL